LASGYRGIQVVVPGEVLESTLNALTGVSRRTPLRFDAPVDLERSAGASVMRMLEFVIAEADREGSVMNAPLIKAQLAETLVCSLLLGFPHNHSRLLHSAAPKIAPAYLRRVEEYIAANAHRYIAIGDLAKVAGVS